jgi:hypothetical protein
MSVKATVELTQTVVVPDIGAGVGLTVIGLTTKHPFGTV